MSRIDTYRVPAHTETERIIAIIDKDLPQKFQEENAMLGCGAASIFHPVVRRQSIDEKIEKDRTREEFRQAAAQILKNVLPGNHLGSMDVPFGEGSKAIRLVFFEADKPLTIDFGNKPATKENASLILAGLEYWEGYNGSYFTNSDNICDALLNGRYRVHINTIDYHSQWFFADMLIQKEMTFPKQGIYRLCRADRYVL